MKCAHPMVLGKGKDGLKRAHRCGQCANCRTTRSQEWALRILMEAKCHDHSVFVTLTYDPDHVPVGYQLCKKDLQDFHKRLRKKAGFRFFAVGEYGPKTRRPHYHGVYFGLSASDEERIHQAWGNGNVKVDELTIGRASYAAKYCLKKHTSPDDFPDGRAPEFSLMSRRPGIGVPFLPKIADTYAKQEWFNLPVHPPAVIRMNGKKWPLDPHMKNKLCQLGPFKKQPVTVSDLCVELGEREYMHALGIDGSTERQRYDKRDQIEMAQSRALVKKVKKAVL